MRVYLASSWRNEQQPSVLAALRAAGHDVYDFRNPEAGNTGFRWSDIDPDWKAWSPERYRDALAHPIAVAGLDHDMKALAASDACVMLQPSGRSAALELGFAVGAGLYTVTILAPGQEPEHMLAMCDALVLSAQQAVVALADLEKARADGVRRRAFCVGCREREDHSGACDCSGNTRTCDPRRGPYGTPCSCWVCSARRRGEDPAEVARQARARRKAIAR